MGLLSQPAALPDRAERIGTSTSAILSQGMEADAMRRKIMRVFFDSQAVLRFSS
jgi:hypothetical protein